MTWSSVPKKVCLETCVDAVIIVLKYERLPACTKALPLRPLNWLIRSAAFNTMLISSDFNSAIKGATMPVNTKTSVGSLQHFVAHVMPETSINAYRCAVC